MLAACAVLPLLAPEVWNGFRLALSDPVLGVLSPLEALRWRSKEAFDELDKEKAKRKAVK